MLQEHFVAPFNYLEKLASSVDLAPRRRGCGHVFTDPSGMQSLLQAQIFLQKLEGICLHLLRGGLEGLSGKKFYVQSLGGGSSLHRASSWLFRF